VCTSPGQIGVLLGIGFSSFGRLPVLVRVTLASGVCLIGRIQPLISKIRNTQTYMYASISTGLVTTVTTMAEKANYIPISHEAYTLVPPRPEEKKCTLARAARAFGFTAIALFSVHMVLSSVNFSHLGRTTGCGGHGRLIHDAKLKLPAYYSLPSGDRIPSVAFGTTLDFKARMDPWQLTIYWFYRHVYAGDSPRSSW
jgi:hypothetical protein